MTIVRTNAARRLSWVLAAIAVTAVVAGTVIGAIDDVLPGYSDESWSLLPLAVGFPLVGAVVISRHPRHGLGWTYIGSGLGAGLALLTARYANHTLVVAPGSLPAGRAVAWVSSWMWLTGVTPILTYGLLLFPDGKLPSPRWRVVARAAGGALVIRVAAAAVMPAIYFGHVPIDNPLGVPGAGPAAAAADAVGYGVTSICSLASLAAIPVRFQRGNDIERRQLGWLLYTICLVLVAYSLNWAPVSSAVPEALLTAAMACIPVAIGIAVLREGLYQIDVLINRSIVYAILTAALAGAYLAVVQLARLLVGQAIGTAASVVATAFVAVAFAPLRAWLQHQVDRLLYGERNSPDLAMRRFDRRLQTADEPEAVLPSLLAAVAETLRLPYVAIHLGSRPGPPDLERGRLFGAPLSIALLHHGVVEGELLLGPRGPSERLTDADKNVIKELAAHAAVSVHALRLTDALRRSRTEAVAALEDERRRLRGDLHDGLGSTLAGIAIGLETCGELVTEAPEQATKLLSRLEEETKNALRSIRQLVYGLRPPALDDLGLIGAVQAQLAVLTHPANGMRVDLCAPSDLGRLPAGVEVAAYRIALEGVTNATRHANATRCTVRICRDQALHVDISDNGAGMAPDWHPGVGVASMRERAAQLGGTLTIRPRAGGGTSVSAILPTEGP